MGNARKFFRSIATFAVAAIVAISAIGSASTLASAAAAHEPEHFDWPASLAPFGDGYPNAGDSCRRLGESAETSAYLDHTATLIGCPGSGDSASARAILHDRRGHVVGEAEGVTLISVPRDGAMSHAAPRHKKKQGCE